MNCFKKITHYLLLICCHLLFCSLFSFGQKNSAGVNISPTVNYRKLGDNSKYLNQFDSKAVIANAGFFYSRNLSKQVLLTTGIDYSIMGYNRKPVFNAGYAFAYTASLKYRLNYIGVPLVVNVKAIHYRKFSLSVATGIVNKFLLFARYVPYDLQRPPLFYGNGNPNLTQPTTVTIRNDSLNSAGYNRYVPELTCGLAFSYLFKNILASLSPEVRYSLAYTTKDFTHFHTNHEYLYSYGLRLAVSKNW